MVLVLPSPYYVFLRMVVRTQNVNKISIYLNVRQFPIHPQTAIGTVKYKYINTPALYAKNSSGTEVKLSVVDLMFVTFVELQVFAHNTMFALV